MERFERVSGNEHLVGDKPTPTRDILRGGRLMKKQRNWSQG